MPRVRLRLVPLRPPSGAELLPAPGGLSAGAGGRQGAGGHGGLCGGGDGGEGGGAARGGHGLQGGLVCHRYTWTKMSSFSAHKFNICAGGDGTWRDNLSIANILRRFNPHLVGVSRGGCLFFFFQTKICFLTYFS